MINDEIPMARPVIFISECSLLPNIFLHIILKWYLNIVFRLIYSYLKLSTGFLVAARQLCQLTVSNATTIVAAPAAIKTHQLRSVL
jgi:hypothetical protein